MAPKKREQPFKPEDLSQLLDLDTVVDETPEPAADEKGEVAVDVTAVDAPEKSERELALENQIAELQAQMAKVLAAQTSAPASAARPKAWEELTPEERRQREVEDQRARANAKALENAPEKFEEVSSGESILIHFVEDGFSALGRTWYRGQELEFDVHGEAYEATKDRNGRSWLEDTEADQGRRYKKLYWRRGPWPGDGYSEDAAAQAERQRNRKAPIPASV